MANKANQAADKATGTPSENLRNAKPIAWVHVPKTGTSFLDALYHHNGICPFLPKDKMVSDSDWGGTWPPRKTACPGAFLDFRKPGWFYPEGTHGGLGENTYNEYIRGHGMIFLRQPEQRVLSQYDWEHSPMGLRAALPIRGVRKSDVEAVMKNPTQLRSFEDQRSLSQYVRDNSGCYAKMISRGGQASCWLPVPPSDKEVETAMHRLREGFVFIGLTDEWDLSLCLFHKMFGGEARQSDLENINPGNQSLDKLDTRFHHAQYNTSVLGDYRDEADNAIYEEAKRIFGEKLIEYGVTHESCNTLYSAARSYQ